LRKALLIGNASYEDARLRYLKNPRTDVEELGAVLRDPDIGDFAVASLIDATVQEMRISIAHFCMDAEKGDTLCVYYSGHAAKDDEGRLFLGAKDTDLKLLSATGLPAQFLLDELGHSRSQSLALILECRNAAAALLGPYGGVPRNMVILAASGPFSYVVEGDNTPATPNLSAFTSSLIAGLNSGDADTDGDGIITFEELFGYTKARIEQRNRPDQRGRGRPRLFNLAEGSVIAGFVPKPVFLSYSRDDKSFAVRIGEALREIGHKVWIDTSSIPGGDDWRESIQLGISASKAVIVVLSPDAVASPWVQREISYADSLKKPILPIVHRQCEFPGWYELQFGSVNRIDFSDSANAVPREYASFVHLAPLARFEEI
jgi:hypothetical protein